ncbi:PEP/pyruvate-binding domain-containing protein [Sphingobium subterraneum]|uniref:Phosphoenolpyruvate synthase n=1 Tax=Sphingobium subterraneum TaxID=627688 RepID=A0A841J8E4_9SPHN|nr:PEP/pyruvate-binding domain-containing protein [Sphingobium subterraneum]MBB6124441.1 hypothetical protein [Sphingobium subterraneum]
MARSLFKIGILTAICFCCANTDVFADGGKNRQSRTSDKVASVAKSQDIIPDAATFDAFARTERAGRFMELPQVMFAIDRSKVPARVIWINTKQYRFHYDYLRSAYLTLADAEIFNATNYSRPDRRFLLGSVVRYPRLVRYGVEFWEGDILQSELLAGAMRDLQESFFVPLTFKPNSDSQREAAAKAGLTTIGIEEAYGSAEQLVLNPGRAVGRLMLVADGDENALLPGDIALLTTVPVRMPPVAGIISASFTTPINHISLLAKTWRIPNAYRNGADSLFAALIGKQVVLDTRKSPVVIREATVHEIAENAKFRRLRAVQAAPADVTYSGLPTLSEQDAKWSRRTGAKAANLAEVAALARRDPYHMFDVPEGFSVPFSFYERFVVANKIDQQINRLLDDPRLSDAECRTKELARIRQLFAQGHIPPTDFAMIASKRLSLLGDKGVFVRSSTNAEDLPRFNGAGLYDTLPNVKASEDLERAIKTVWGSLWNDRAFAARESAGINHRSVRAAILIQRGIDADAAGVMTTIDPFDENADERRLFLAAKRGLGIRVVEGKKIAEQLIYRPDLNSVQVLTRSQDDVMLHFGPGGGIEEIQTIADRAVLADALVARLGKIGLAIQSAFDGRPQDIEWLVVGGRILIVQSRNYVKGH